MKKKLVHQTSFSITDVITYLLSQKMQCVLALERPQAIKSS